MSNYKAMYYRLFNETTATAETLEEIAKILTGIYFSQRPPEPETMIRALDTIGAVITRLKQAQIDTEEIYTTEKPVKLKIIS